MITTLEKVRDFLIAKHSFLNEGNCDIDNPMVFDNSLMENNEYACLISGGWSIKDTARPGNFGEDLFRWEVIINFFRLVGGSKDQQAWETQDAYTKIEFLHIEFVRDPTLSGEVTDASIVTIQPPMTFARSDRDEWVLIPMILHVKEIIQ